MTRIMTNQLEPGMVLDEDVRNCNGNVLIRAGTELADKHIRGLKMWGIDDVAVVSEGAAGDDSSAGTVDEALLEATRQELSDRFRHTDVGHDAMAMIFDFAVTHWARQKVQRSGNG